MAKALATRRPIHYWNRRGLWLGVLALLILIQNVGGYLQPQDILLVVNDDSPTSKYVADLYRQYYPSITSDQVVHLSGLPDATVSSANEIIFRGDFNTKIAAPIRQHLIDHGRVDSTKAIVTTAGLPYRIEDSDQTLYPNVVYNHGSQPYPSGATGYIQAASVESELSVLFQIDPASPNPLDLHNRIINPYQGYRQSSIGDFPRDMLANRHNMSWFTMSVMGGTVTPPLAEGTQDGFGVRDRHMSAGDIYLTCRLDAPKTQGGNESIFAVHDLLERSRRASDSAIGVNPQQATVALDDIGGKLNSGLDYNKIFNVQSGTYYNQYIPGTPQPPDITMPGSRDDYSSAYQRMTGLSIIKDQLNMGTMSTAQDMTVMFDHRPGERTSQADIGTGALAVAVASYGVNGDEGNPSNYLLEGGPGGTALFDLAYGAVFDSIESFNAVTFFSDVDTQPMPQGKIMDFISIGGSGAIGHAFEPISDAIVDNEYFFYNLLADHDSDGVADLTFAEAAFTALPYLSWSEVVIGDPLMRLAFGPGGRANPSRLLGDVNLDGYVDELDMTLASAHMDSVFGDGGGLYLDTADINRDGQVTRYDLWLISSYLGNYDPLAFGEGYSPPPIPEPSTLTFFLTVISITRYAKRSKK